MEKFLECHGGAIGVPIAYGGEMGMAGQGSWRGIANQDFNLAH